MKLRNICFITDGYPSEYYVINAFVETLVNEMTDRGVNCYVIAPQSITNAIVYNRKILPYIRKRKTNKGNEVVIYSPKYISFSAKKIGNMNTVAFGLKSFKYAAEKAYKEIAINAEIDAFYGHFIFPSGITANFLGNKYGIPAFFAYGENTTYTIDYLGDNRTRGLLTGISGVISVSSENKRVLIEKNMVDKARIGVFPNSVDNKLFYPRDKAECRQILGLPEDDFIVAFVGRFLDVKGPDRLSAALEKLDDEKVSAIFIGEGKQKPTYKNIVFCGAVQHDELPVYLSAADVFALPTKAEGCCNAIIEAMACGLPIISSDMPFNRDILDADNALLINPCDVKDISKAIMRLKNDGELKERMSEASLKNAEKLTISTRTDNIIGFIENCV